MKKHLSVFLLMVRSSFYPILGLLVLLAAVQGGIFWLVLCGSTGEGLLLENVVAGSRLGLVFGLFFFRVSHFLIRTGRLPGSRQGYTLGRLGVSERWVFFWQAVYNVLMYALFYMAECLIVLGLSQIYIHHAPAEYVTGQTVFLAFYRSPLLHSLLPMEDGLVWLRNIVLLLSLGICAAQYPMGIRRGKRAKAVVFLMAMVPTFFVQPLGSSPLYVFQMIFCLFFVAFCLYKALIPEEVEDDEET